jgi:LCP family protein required for cell wall assembly
LAALETPGPLHARRTPPPAARPRAAAARPAVRGADLAGRWTAVAVAPGLDDGRRLVAAFLSGVLPGLGQLANGRRTLATRFLVPSLIVLALVLAVWWITPTGRLLAILVIPTTLLTVLALNVVVAAWRIAATGQAFFDRRFRSRPGGIGLAGLVVILVLVALPHLVAGYVGWVAHDAFERVFSGPLGAAEAGDGGPRSPGPALVAGERVNVLLTGVDRRAGRNHALTDTMIVVSLDPVGRTVSMVSIPRDTVDVPLGDGNVYGPKLNSLQGYAAAHPDDFPNGADRALPDAIGTLLGIPIHYTAEADLAGFVEMVDAVGGVDVEVERPLTDPKYGGFGVGPGWSITAGRHHLDGANALAYARIRRSEGESDFTRAGRQQEVLVALRDAAVADGQLLFRLPDLLDSVGDTLRTDIPPLLLPELAALADEIGADDTTLVVIKRPLVKSGGRNHRYGSVQVPDVAAIQAMAKLVFSEPGTPPTPWPTPKPTPSAAPSPAP